MVPGSRSSAHGVDKRFKGSGGWGGKMGRARSSIHHRALVPQSRWWTMTTWDVQLSDFIDGVYLRAPVTP